MSKPMMDLLEETIIGLRKGTFRTLSSAKSWMERRAKEEGYDKKDIESFIEYYEKALKLAESSNLTSQ